MPLERARILREAGPLNRSDYSEYDDLRFHGIPVAAILQTCNSVAAQPNPGFAADSNYLRQQLLKRDHLRRSAFASSEGMIRSVNWLRRNSRALRLGAVS